MRSVVPLVKQGGHPENEFQRGYVPQEPAAGLDKFGRLALGVFAAAAAYFLWTEHRAHLIEYLPWGILALCPVMHFFMHGGHGSHGSRHGSPQSGGKEREP